MDAQKQIIEKLKQATNVLVTVSNNPSVDQLAALLGLGLALTKLDKHSSAVYSGETPSTIAFLQPEETIEKNTDSLRDFIISLDKSKADKLRYKVEDSVVRIFITPYRTSISDADLEFSQGDFNVDAVVALGVHEQEDLDQAITSHGRIFHDATIVTINNQQAAELGSVNWLNESASSISEMVTALVGGLGKDVLDEQIATALLTGIVAETDRFSNEKTTATTMKASAALLAAGANQHLVATQLEEAEKVAESTEFDYEEDHKTTEETHEEEVPAPEPTHAEEDDGTLQIVHDEPENVPEPQPEPEVETENYELPSVPEQVEFSEPTHDFSPKQDPEPEYPPAPGLTIAPQPSHDVIDELLLPPKEPETFPTISKAYASGESALYESHNGEQKSHKLMVDNPVFASSEGNAEDQEDDEFSLPSSDDDEDHIENKNSYVLGDHDKPHTSTPPPPPPSPVTFPSPINVIPPPTDPEWHEPKHDTKPEPVAEPKQPDHPHFVPRPGETLAELEEEVHSPYVKLSPYDELDMQLMSHPAGQVQPPEQPSVSVDSARDAVAQAMAVANQPLEPIIALNAQPLGAPLHEAPQPYSPPVIPAPQPVNASPSDPEPISLPTPPYAPQPAAPAFPSQPVAPPSFSPTPSPSPYSTAPPVPPPIMPPYNG